MLSSCRYVRSLVRAYTLLSDCFGFFISWLLNCCDCTRTVDTIAMYLDSDRTSIYVSLPSTTISLRRTPGLLLAVPLCHSMQARRNVITYKSRNRRKRDLDDDQSHVLTSPLSEIDKDETTLSEMNRRMGKRSRLLVASSIPDLSAIADTSQGSTSPRSSKRPRVGDGTSAASGPLSTVFNAELHANSFRTPVTSALPPGKRTSSGSLNHRPASSLSPVPLTKLAFDSGAKENFVTSRPQTDLASPFNSHPNSRNASPKSQSKPKPTKRPRTKPRTLSAYLSENHEIIATATDAAPSPDRKKAKTLHHGRNPSLPSLAADGSPDWLNYGKAKPSKPVRGSGRRNVRGSSRSIFSSSSSGSQPRFQLLPIQHPSFSLEVPLAFSTPPTKRHLSPSPQYSVDWGRTNLARRLLDTDAEDEDEDVEMADAEASIPDSASRAPRTTKTRRQTVRISHDSLFSSMEVSDSGSASTITGVSARAPSDDTAVNPSSGNGSPDPTALSSVMSLTGTFEPTNTNKFPDLGQPFEDPRDHISDCDWMADDERVSNALMKDQPKDRSARKKSSAACLDDLEALGAKVSEMNLEGLVYFVVNRSASEG